jgi:hypothetical protein
VISRASVDLPDPEGPTIASAFPAGNSKETSRRIGRSLFGMWNTRRSTESAPRKGGSSVRRISGAPDTNALRRCQDWYPAAI